MSGIANPQIDEMIERLSQRLEAEFALTVIDPQPISVPGDQGSVLGQVQAEDGTGRKIAFYLRPAAASQSVPAYVSRLSRATYLAETNVRVCIVIAETDDGAEADARACGAGLLVMTSESLTQVVEPSLPSDDLNESELEELAADVRRHIIRAAQLRITELETSYHRAREVVDPADTKAKDLLRQIKKKCSKCECWQEELTKEWDNASRRGDREALEALAQRALNDEPDA
jgi:hypothetical protein